MSTHHRSPPFPVAPEERRAFWFPFHSSAFNAVVLERSSFFGRFPAQPGLEACLLGRPGATGIGPWLCRLGTIGPCRGAGTGAVRVHLSKNVTDVVSMVACKSNDSFRFGVSDTQPIQKPFGGGTSVVSRPPRCRSSLKGQIHGRGGFAYGSFAYLPARCTIRGYSQGCGRVAGS